MTARPFGRSAALALPNALPLCRFSALGRCDAWRFTALVFSGTRRVQQLWRWEDLALSGAQWRSLSALGYSGSRPILVFHHLGPRLPGSQRSFNVGRPGAWLVHALSRPGCCRSLVIAPLYVLFLFPSHILVVVTHPHSSAYLFFCTWSTIVRPFSGGMVLVPVVSINTFSCMEFFK